MWSTEEPAKIEEIVEEKVEHGTLSSLGKKTELLFYKGKIKNETVNVLIDSGATSNFISQQLADHLKVITSPREAAMLVEVADGGTQRVTHTAKNLPISIESYQDALNFEIIGMPGPSIVFGKNWLDQKNPNIDWPSGTMEFTHRSKDIKLVSKSKNGEI